MQIGTLFLSGVVTALTGLLPLALPGTASEPLPEGPRVVRLDPQPFEHRIDGDWQRNGLPADAPMAVVSIPAPVEIMAVPVSHADWMDCVVAGACAAPGQIAATPDLPVTAVHWYDAQAYAAWLSEKAWKALNQTADALGM